MYENVRESAGREEMEDQEMPIVKKKAESMAAETKPAAKRTAAKKPAEKSAAARTPRKAAAPKVQLYIQYGGKEGTEAELVEAVKAACGVTVKTMELYVKPEDGAVYYVVNGTESGKVEL